MENFIPVDEVISVVKEELNSYLSSGAIDDVLFPKWVEYALNNFKKSALPIKSVALELCNFEADLPDDFDSVRELWLCGTSYSYPIEDPTSRYYVKDCRITPIDDPCHECFDEVDCCNYCSPNHPDQKKKFKVTHQVTGFTYYEYKFQELLTPATVNSRRWCSSDCSNIKATSQNEFEIIDGCKLTTNFREGVLHLVYYGKNIDSNGTLLMQDNQYIKNYIISHLKYKIFETLSNNISDETYNQISQKMMYYKQESINNKIIAETELKKWDKHEVARQIRKRKNRFQGFRSSLRLR